MILNEFIETVADDRILYIGSKISFIFIGTKKRWNELNERIYRVHRVKAERLLLGAKTESLKKRYAERLKEMKPFGEREVIAIYPHQSAPGTNVRIEGNEHGGYWFLSEFEKDFGKEK